MANEPEIVKELSIFNLLTKDKYIIPIYQRNYAWDKAEITQLIQDIIDKSENENSNYYLGTLIVDKKHKNNEDYFEVIDGQQRHTTLTLLNAFFNRKEEKKQFSNLYFDARVFVKRLIDSIYQKYDDAKDFSQIDDSVNNIIRGIYIIDDFFASNLDLRGNVINEDKLKSYFLNNVKIIRVNVPKDTDINHYFEIMNTRGIQLEKHQILKAAFIENIKGEEKDKLSKSFALIWDACSVMDKYIQYCFKSELRTTIFGKDLSGIPHSGIEGIKESFAPNNANEHNDLIPRTLLNILKGEFKTPEFLPDSNYSEGKYSSIIDFPNFLLQTLKLFKEGSVSLDDKNLLTSFGYEEKKLPDSIEFINFLLKIRTLFDRYIIKKQIDNSDETKWKILKPSDDATYLVNTFNEEKDYKILMLQSMFQVSFPNNSYKNWLYDLLCCINKGEKQFVNEEFFNFVFNKAKEEYDRISSGTGINNYIFNYVDFLLWKEYNDTVKSKQSPFEEDTILGRISKQRKYFETFKFTQRSSVEHIHPQSKIFELKDETEDERKKTLNHFGNLCLISRNTNSKYNDYNFHAKKEQFEKRITTESLKQAIVFSYSEWNTEEIKKHGEQLLDLIKKN